MGDKKTNEQKPTEKPIENPAKAAAKAATAAASKKSSAKSKKSNPASAASLASADGPRLAKAVASASKKLSDAKTTTLARRDARPPMRVSKKSKRKTPLPKVTIETAEVIKEAGKPVRRIPVTTADAEKIKNDKKSREAAQKSGAKNRNLPKSPRRFLHIKIRYILAAIVVLILTIFTLRVAAWERTYLATMEGSERHVVSSGSGSSNENKEVYDGGSSVDNTEPTPVQIAEYHVAANRPRYLTIPILNIRNARIVEIGRRADGSMDSPYNIHNVGWYTESVLPGAAGVTVMDAHGGDMGNGIFRYLPRIGIGDEIKIEMGDEKTIYVYTVKQVATKAIGAEANNYMSTIFQPVTPGKPTLSLITCTGDWLQKSQTYSHRFFVRAELTGTLTK